MESIVENLVLLGMKEYEAKVYVALVGMGEGNARRIHETSGVPRPRVYDILEGLAARGFVEVRQGSPLVYRPVNPETVVARLKGDIDAAARESVEALEKLSLDAQQQYTPIWYVRGDWSIGHHLRAVLESVEDDLLILSLDNRIVEKYADLIARVGRQHRVRILYARRQEAPPVPNAAAYEVASLCDYFRENIYERVLAAPVLREGSTFAAECILLADEQESMLVYTLDGERMAVIITLPFITCMQGRLLEQMLLQAQPLEAPRE